MLDLREPIVFPGVIGPLWVLPLDSFVRDRDTCELFARVSIFNGKKCPLALVIRSPMYGEMMFKKTGRKGKATVYLPVDPRDSKRFKTIYVVDAVPINQD